MKACAYVVGPGKGPAAALSDLAARLRFEHVIPYEGLRQVERQTDPPLAFFLFAEAPDPSHFASAAQAIRFSSERRVRFSPMIYFCTTPSLDTMRRLINMGFDDVIAAPFTLARISARLLRQIDTPLTHYETSSYFGPDRRGRLIPDAGHERRGEGGSFRRLQIVRRPHTGISVLDDDVEVLV